MTERAVDWTVDIFIEESDDLTRARARLQTRDTQMTATGSARRSPRDPAVPEIGDELATARALMALAEQLLHSAASDIEAAAATAAAGKH